MQIPPKSSSRRSTFLHFLRFLHFFLDIYLEKTEYFVSNLFNLSHFVISLVLSGESGRRGGRKYAESGQIMAPSDPLFYLFYVFYIFSWTYIWKNLNILSQITLI